MARYMTFDNRTLKPIKLFNKKKDVENHLIDGLMSTEGAESDHFKYMLRQLYFGRKILLYWED